nr:cob(I)yrinic acid a,c-diamide adenosyltransferase [Lachnospiraceae bacterium]
MVHLYHGDGKGKTTAAVGLSVRAAGAGLKVVFVQFIKARHSTEIKNLEMLGITVIRPQGKSKFASKMNEEELDALKIVHDENLEKALSLNPDLLILDEACAALKYGCVDEGLLKSAMEYGREKEAVFTGRNPAQWMLDGADYV